MPYVVRLEPFEGPLDLLLQLISKAQVDIADIFVSQITEQYLETIAQMSFLDMDSASEFLTMAATLMQIKSSKLLPVIPNPDEEEPEDPQAALIRQLEEYQRFRQVSQSLAQLESEFFMQVYQKLPEEYAAPDTEPLLEGMTLKRLFEAFERVYLNRSERETDTMEPIQTLSRDTFTVQDRIFHIQRALKDGGRISFTQLLAPPATRAEIVTTFMALLELLRLGRLSVQQDGLYGEIYIKGAKKTRDDGAD